MSGDWSTRQAQGRLNTIIFVSSFCFHEDGTSQFTTEASAWLFYFLLGSYSLSTLACLVHLDFSLSLNQGQSNHPPRHWASAQNAVTYSMCTLFPEFTVPGWKLLLLHIFPIPTYHRVTLISSTPLTQLTWHFRFLLFTLRHRWILFLKFTNLDDLSKVKYIIHSHHTENSFKYWRNFCRILYI